LKNRSTKYKSNCFESYLEVNLCSLTARY